MGSTSSPGTATRPSKARYLQLRVDLHADPTGDFIHGLHLPVVFSWAFSSTCSSRCGSGAAPAGLPRCLLPPSPPPPRLPVLPPRSRAAPAPAARRRLESACPKCGAVVYAGESRCWKCGTPLISGRSPPATGDAVFRPGTVGRHSGELQAREADRRAAADSVLGEA